MTEARSSASMSSFQLAESRLCVFHFTMISISYLFVELITVY